MGGKDLSKSINPDEAVAYGAAVQGAILDGIRNDATNSLLLVDVTPLSLGIETTGKVMSVIIKRNTAIPVKKTKIFTTEEDYVKTEDVVIFEGERANVDANNKLGEFKIHGIERAKRGEPKIEVTFEIDANGILNVTAKDKKTGSRAETTIANNRGRLTQEGIDRLVEARNEFERFIHDNLSYARSKNNTEAESKLNEAREWLDDHEDATVKQIEDKQRLLNRAIR